ncbi:uncharacterized protein GGS22DRAFT_113836 [Annulohypoxylon maeteangense]|uniref:uncharacterized protein n=1 Tax=Annulohypoxylon maeteangense TaxID=1927788 RepID=UPI002007425A|nr:uncharacterized protein GGS22DRAFT_113836 [Annulohypoxylon maeteangense]KAI0886459.1 hypothetical protein GGS22DRAFT_113836 [Annulohypoxylon maeteangense]
MGYTHRDNAQFSRSGWRKRILLPCWIIQIGLLLATMGLFSYRLSHTIKTWKDEEDLGNIPMVEFVWEAVNVAFSFISLVITFFSIAKFIAEVLTPLPLLFSNILNLVFASAVLALDIVVYLKHTEKQYSLAGLAMDCALMFFTIIPAIYSYIIYRRLLSYDDYHIPGNVKPYGYASEPEDTAYRSSWLEPPVPYDPTNPGGVTRPRALSAASRRLSLSLSSRAASPQLTPPTPERVPGERRGSYTHKRDTQFDEYVKRRSSGYTKLDVERALGVEFGWEDTQDTRDSMISSGSVTISQARARGDSLSTQQASMEAIISRNSSTATTTTNTNSTVTLDAPSGMVRAHSLNSVPEAQEEEGLGLEKKKTKADREALLSGVETKGISRSSSGSSRKSVRLIEQVDGLEDIDLNGQRRKRNL